MIDSVLAGRPFRAVVIPECMLDGEGGQALPDEEEPTTEARLEVAERDLRDVRALLDGTRRDLDRAQRAVMVLVGSLTELIEAAETAANATADTPFGRCSSDALRAISADAREAIRIATGAP